MSIISKPNTFTDNTTAEASEVNDNFDTIYNDYNGGISAANLATDAVTTGKIADSNVTTAKIADSAVTSAKVAAGAAVQVAYTASSAVATGTTLIPIDNTIPQITEGNEYMTLAITPKSSTNILVIQATISVSSSAAATWLVGALFQDATTNALAAMPVYQPTAQGGVCIIITHTMVAGTTSSTTFRVRAGANNAGTTSFNGTNGAQVFSTATKSSIVITEYKA